MATELTPENLAKLRELAKAAESFTAGKPWSYDEEAADVHNGIRERGKHILDYGASFVVCDPAMKDDNLDRVAAFGRHIAAADPQTVLALVEEVERLRERLAELTTSLHEIAQKLQNGMDANPASSCDIFATLLYMHGLWMGRDLAADQQQETTDG